MEVKLPRVSVVVPVYNEEELIGIFYEKLKDALGKLAMDYEILFINDASVDGSTQLLESLQLEDQKVKVVNLERRVGQLRALKIGLDKAEGDILVTMDADLQNDPDDIKKFIDELEKGYEAVGGVRASREDPFLRKVLSRVANLLVRLLSKKKVSDLGCSFNAITRRAYQRVSNYYGGEFLVTKPLFVKFCRNFSEIKVKHYPRFRGKSKQSFKSLFYLFLLNILTAVSFLPKFQIYVMKRLSRR